jgi:hypothetical protein
MMYLKYVIPTVQKRFVVWLNMSNFIMESLRDAFYATRGTVR